MSAETGYNGWRNYETWCVKLWIDNDEGEHYRWRQEARDAWADGIHPQYPGQSRRDAARNYLAERLKDAWGDASPDLGSTVWADLLGAALGEVDWHEIATAMLDDEDDLGDDDAGTVEVDS